MRWLERYRAGGLERLVELDYRQCGRPGVLPAPVRSALQARLADPEQGFASYGEIQQWLAEEWGLTVKYPTMHRIVRYQLRAKLKVPRPRHIDQSPAEVVAFKKWSAQTVSYSKYASLLWASSDSFVDGICCCVLFR